MDISLVIPAYNEAHRIGTTLEALAQHVSVGGLGTAALEVIVVCDGCRDATEAVARTYDGRLPLRTIAYPENRGKGYAVRQGVLGSTGTIVAFMDADGATPVRELTRLTAPIRRGEADIVVGSRRVAGAVLPVPQPWHRWLLGSIFTLHARLVLGVRVQDTQCGFKVFRGDLARDLFAGLRCDGYAFDLELLAVAHSRHVRVLEMGVEWHNVPGSSISPLRDGLRMLAATWRIRAMHGRHDPSSKPRGAAERVVATTPERRGGPPA